MASSTYTPEARIRPYKPEDDRLARFFIGKSQMEGLAVSNRKVYFNPLSVAAWITLSAVFVELMGWRPVSGDWFTYFKPLPAFAAVAVPLMFLVDWYNRPGFEERVQEILKRPDVHDIPGYYSRSPASGFWLLEYKNDFIGFIAVDASSSSTSDESVIVSSSPSTEDPKQKPSTTVPDNKKKGTSKVATVRHFYVKEEYRPSQVQDDLLEFALKHTFSADKTVERVRAVDSDIHQWAVEAFDKQGFSVEKTVGKVGILSWALRERVVSRDKWQGSQKQ